MLWISVKQVKQKVLILRVSPTSCVNNAVALRVRITVDQLRGFLQCVCIEHFQTPRQLGCTYTGSRLQIFSRVC